MKRNVFYCSHWILLLTALLLFPGVSASNRTQAATIWPGRAWETASPASQGLSQEGLDAAANYASASGGGSGCVIRGGYLVKEWGDPQKRADIKSCTKGSLGATALGLALDRNLVDWDDRANTHYRGLGRGVAANAETGWLDNITIRHLATMTAGFDDGRPPQLAYRPGTSGIYSNDSANLLAELLTIKFNEDLYTLMKREVMDPIGVSASDWKWRNNSYRQDSVQGIKSREFLRPAYHAPRPGPHRLPLPAPRPVEGQTDPQTRNDRETRRTHLAPRPLGLLRGLLGLQPEWKLP